MKYPIDCPEEIKELMGECWKEDPNSRPTFKQLYNRIKNVTPNDDVKKEKTQDSGERASIVFYS